MRYDVIEKIGEGNRGEVYKVRLEDGRIAALKWSKNYEIDKEWEILNYLNGFYAPKPLFRGNRYIVMELIEGKPLKELLNTPEFYNAMKLSLIAAFKLDEKKVFHKQLGRFYHILYNGDNVKFIDFERAVITPKSRNFLQLIGYYLQRDENFDKNRINLILNLYKQDKIKALEESIKAVDEAKNKAIFKQ